MSCAGPLNASARLLSLLVLFSTFPSVALGQSPIESFPDCKFDYTVENPFTGEEANVSFVSIGNKFFYERKWKSNEGKLLTSVTGYDGKSYFSFNPFTSVLVISSDYTKMRPRLIGDWGKNPIFNPWYTLTYLPTTQSLSFDKTKNFGIDKFLDGSSGYTFNISGNSLEIRDASTDKATYADTGFPIFEGIVFDAASLAPKEIIVPYPGHTQSCFWKAEKYFSPLPTVTIPSIISYVGNCQFDYVITLNEESFKLISEDDSKNFSFRFPSSMADHIDDLDLGETTSKP